MKNKTYLYRRSLEYARQTKQISLWRASHQVNIACKEAIEESIRQGFDGMHLKEGCVQGVLEEYGFKRVNWVLANTVREKLWDGRFSQSNKEWARGQKVPPDPDHNCDFVVESHPAVLDGFLREVRAEFQKMIRGEYKDAYTKEFQRQFNARFKDAKATQERLDSYQPIIDMLSSRYNISDGDMGKLSSAIRSDRAIWAEAAEAAGLTVEQFQRVQDSELERQRLQAENDRLRAAQRQSIQNQMAQRQMEVWNGQVEELKKDYPDFNIEVELANPAFSAMLRAGSSVRNAYEAAHLEEIKQSLVQATTQKTTKEVTDNIKAKGMRPTEVGGSQAGVPLSVDLKNSTKAQRDEWARRAERGETITFQ